MESISYVTIRPSHFPSQQTQGIWYGTAPGLTSITKHLYQDNSFAKYDYVQRVYERKITTVNKTYKAAKSKVENLRSQLHFSFICKNQLMAIYQRKKKKSELILKAAIKIQKNIRGYLARKKYQAVFFT